MYTKLVPCFACAKMIINAGIERVVAEKDYYDSNLTKEFFKRARVKLVILKNEVEEYPSQK
jgi:deoxycytidylate deaminase